MKSNFLHVIAIGAFTAGIPALSTHATERRFTNVYEATTIAKGGIEFENWATWKTRHDRDRTNGGDEFDFRHELEFGVTDRLQISIYGADWSVTDNAETRRHTRYEDSAVEVIYTLTNPTIDWLGSALYGEVRVGDRFLELEGKVVLQKNFGPWLIAYNATIEAQYEGAHLDERNGEFGESLGVSHQFAPQLTVGAEVLHEIALPDWDSAAKSVVYAGPNVSVRHGNVFATLTPLIQVTKVRDEPEFQTRLIFGVHF